MPDEAIQDRRYIQVLQQNCQRKLTTVQTVLNDDEASKADIVCFQEPSTNKSSLPPMHHSYHLCLPTVNYNDHRIRSCIYLSKQTIPANAYRAVPCNSPYVTAILLIQVDAPDLMIINVYADQQQHRALEHLISLLEVIAQTDILVLLLGDFNLHAALWNPPDYHAIDDAAEEFIDICARYGLELVSEAGKTTRISPIIGHADTTIDLVFASALAANAVSDCRVLPKEELDFLSDHLCLVTTIDLALPRFELEMLFMWHKTDCEVAKEKAVELLSEWYPVLDTPEDVDRAASELIDKLIQIRDVAVPRARASEHAKRWWSDHVKPL
jgi:endonuclease/exonuclease/phosphatase family metal-dependent hydrolase